MIKVILGMRKLDYVVFWMDLTLTPMSSFRIRPRFSQDIPLAQEEIVELLQNHLKDPEVPCVGKIVHNYIVLKILPEEQHYWSPQLSLSLDELEDSSGTRVNGLYGPNPTVWAMFFYGYVILGLLATFAGIFGFALWSLGKGAEILWMIPAFGVIALVMYFIAQTGQKIGAEQMFTLHHFYEETIGKRVHVH